MNSDSKPFLFTFFVANEIKLHLTDSTRADEFTAKHAGKMLTPPLEPDPEPIEEIGEFEYHYTDINGDGWKQAADDITLLGLSWVAVTGVGTAHVRIGVPKDIGITEGKLGCSLSCNISTAEASLTLHSHEDCTVTTEYTLRSYPHLH